jgi:hypothetical protein
MTSGSNLLFRNDSPFSQSKVGMGIVATSGSDDSEWETLTISSDIHTSSLPTTINVLGDNGEIREVNSVLDNFL